MNKVIQLGGSTAFIPTFENAAYGIEWTKDDNDIIHHAIMNVVKDIWTKSFILYIDLIIFLLILKLLNMIGVFMLKIEKKMSNLKHNIL